MNKVWIQRQRRTNKLVHACYEYLEANNTGSSYSNITSYNKLQYGLTLSAGYDAFNVNVYYGLTPILKDAYIGTEKVETKILKFGLIFYIL